MRLSCNFVNVYTIVYHVQYTYTGTRAHPQRTSSREKRACRTKVHGQVGELNRDRPTSAARRATEVGEKVRVGVGVRVGPEEFKFYTAVQPL